MTEYELGKPRSDAANLELKRVDLNEFIRRSRSLDYGGRLSISTSSGREYGIFVENGDDIGYVRGSKDLSYVFGFAIHQDFRGKGYGRRAVEILKENAKNKGGLVAGGVLTSKAGFLEKCGLKITDHREGEVWFADE